VKLHQIYSFGAVGYKYELGHVNLVRDPSARRYHSTICYSKMIKNGHFVCFSR